MLIPGKSHSRVDRRNSWVSILLKYVIGVGLPAGAQCLNRALCGLPLGLAKLEMFHTVHTNKKWCRPFTATMHVTLLAACVACTDVPSAGGRSFSCLRNSSTSNFTVCRLLSSFAPAVSISFLHQIISIHPTNWQAIEVIIIIIIMHKWIVFRCAKVSKH